MFKVLYHANCHDGFCAAWVLYRDYPGADYIPVSYGQEPPDVTGADVTLVDFCYEQDVLLDMARKAASLVVVDHHHSVADWLPVFESRCEAEGIEGVHVVFDEAHSGAMLTWRLLNGQEDPPWLVRYTEDRDLWKWKLTSSREVNAAIRSWPMNFRCWDMLHGKGFIPTSLVQEGEAILRAEQRTIEANLRQAREVEWEGHKVFCVNATALVSEITGALAIGRPFSVSYRDRADGRREYSLRSRKGGVDVSEIAKRYGGGGHKQAAGFEWDQAWHPWDSEPYSVREIDGHPCVVRQDGSYAQFVTRETATGAAAMFANGDMSPSGFFWEKVTDGASAYRFRCESCGRRGNGGPRCSCGGKWAELRPSAPMHGTTEDR